MSQIVKQLYDERNQAAPPSELVFYNRGFQECPSGHYHTSVRNYYLIHLVRSGRGWFRVGEERRELTRGGGFAMFPGMVGEYQADRREPWSYCWLGFHGAMASFHLKDLGIDLENPCFRLESSQAIDRAAGLIREEPNRPMGTGQDEYAGFAQNPLDGRGLVYRFLGILSRDLYGRTGEDKAGYVHRAIDFVKKNFSQPVTVADMARAAGVDRTYLYSLFKEQTGKTPKEYLTDFRLREACELLARGDISVKAAARSVGYRDELNFSRVFSRRMGTAPSRWNSDGLSGRL